MNYFLGVDLRKYRTISFFHNQDTFWTFFPNWIWTIVKVFLFLLPCVPAYHFEYADGSPSTDATCYQCTLGILQYLSLTRPNISYEVYKLSQFMPTPTHEHWKAIKRVYGISKKLRVQHFATFVALTLICMCMLMWTGMAIQMTKSLYQVTTFSLDQIKLVGR